MSEITINGTDYPLPQDPRTTLLDFLHQHLALFGSKKGCDHGQCGACTVIVEGRRVNACLILAFQLEGQSVTTIEGIATEDGLHPLQQAFVERDAFQCGYCTPGQICSAMALIEEWQRGEPSLVRFDPDYDPLDDLKERMSGNLCRCGAYPNIIRAIGDLLPGEKGE